MGWETVDMNTALGKEPQSMFRFGDNKVTVHRHVHHDPEVWCVSCYDLGIVNRSVGKISHVSAQEKALELVEAELMAMLESFEKARAEL